MLSQVLLIMHKGVSTVERAFELARWGRYTSVRDAQRALDSEGYYGRHLQGPLLSRQLANLIAEAKCCEAERN